ncbi:MAG: hypothetical protein ACR2NM_10740, partial [Bythopirellula sp.]
TPEFVKIATFPSFVAAFHALQEVNRRFPAADLPTAPAATSDPTSDAPAEVEPPVEEPLEILPTPTPAGNLPNANRGERSILKRK